MTVDIYCRPEETVFPDVIAKKISQQIGYRPKTDPVLIRRWIDARSRPPKIGLRYQIESTEKDSISSNNHPQYHQVHDAQEVHIIGAGPAGYFAALECLIHGLKPIVLDRGKDVRSRRRDLKAIQQEGVVNPHSNYCFGEGGAGTYSDGKLYTRSKKRGDVSRVLDILVHHGANEDIRIDAHPHIGSNKLPGIISAIRDTIEGRGGQVLFDHFVTDIIVKDRTVNELVINHKKQLTCNNLILATGHSARDIFHLFHEKKWAIEAKSFALGMRIEHPQKLIDKIQYGAYERSEHLPAAEYRLACQVDNRGVFSFCMCPGGLIVPAATAPGEIVVNGMSLSRRESKYANSGFVVAIEPEDLGPVNDAFVCLNFQKQLEQKLFQAGNGSQCAPAQRVKDFIEGRLSSDLPETSYIPGVFSARLDLLLPSFVVERVKQGLKISERKMQGYLSDDAIFVGIESRTSSPVRIPRIPESLNHPQIDNLYPCGEGAGYAGGIVSAAIDGQRVVKSISARHKMHSTD